MPEELEIQEFGDGSFIAEGNDFVYSYSVIGKSLVMSTKNRAESLNLTPSYTDSDKVKDFVSSLEKSSQIKALQMSRDNSLSSLFLVKNGDDAERDIPVLMKEIVATAEMAQLAENGDLITLAEKIGSYTPLRGIDITVHEGETDKYELTCSTLLGNEVCERADTMEELLGKTSATLEELEMVTTAFMRVTKPPLITPPSDKLKLVSQGISPVAPHMRLKPDNTLEAEPVGQKLQNSIPQLG
jgi:hypothetical protein